MAPGWAVEPAGCVALAVCVGDGDAVLERVPREGVRVAVTVVVTVALPLVVVPPAEHEAR